MSLANSYESFLTFLTRHERPLATIVFIFGFVMDVLTFGFLDIPSVTTLFGIYLGIVIVATLIAHISHDKEGYSFVRTVAVLAPLLIQFVLGSLLSGFLIFYTKSAVLSVSWPFLILLLIIFFGNEVFRTYREHLIFQTLMLYFSVYAFSVFALPLYLGKLGTLVFYESTALSLVLFALYMTLLGWLGWERLKSALKTIVLSVLGMTILIVGAYMAGLVPPIPLALKTGAVYQVIDRTETGYAAQGETARPWYDPRQQVVHHAPGAPLYVFSSVFAPVDFSTTVVHVWEWYDPTAQKWVPESTIAFTLSGGRKDGYRGYSLKYDPAPGQWRVLVQTLNGQTIGKITFTVVNTTAAVPLTTKAL